MSSDARRSSKKKRNKSPRKKHSSLLVYIIVAIVVLAIIVAVVYVGFFSKPTTLRSTTTGNQKKWEILYVNQGNGLVSENNFSVMIATAETHGFNTIFFQIYRSGITLFSQAQLMYFVDSAHAHNFSIFFALYFTNSTQKMPTSIFGLGEDGVSLDMSTLPTLDQQALFSSLKGEYSEGKIAITTTDFATTLKPDLLIFETYLPSDQQYIAHGIIAGVEPLSISTRQEYDQQFNYALANSDGVMVFDYYGLLATGY